MKALALLEAPNHVCGRYRIAAFEPALARSGWSLDLVGIAPGPIARTNQFLQASQYDAVILQRKLLPAWQLAVLRRSAKRLIFDFDDAVLYRDSYDPRGPHCKRRAARFHRIATSADQILAGNDFLAELARNAGASGHRVRVIPTCIKTESYPKTSRQLHATTTLVWIGSSSTLQGLEARRSLFERIGREIPNLRLRIIADRAASFDPLPVEFIPWNERTEVASITSADIGISWIPDDLWSRGKCGLKLLQYMGAGLPVVANSVGVHSQMINNHQNGFLADSDESWICAIQKLATDFELRARMGREARLRVEADYSITTWASAFVAAVAGSPPLTSPRIRKGPSIARKAEPR